MSAKRSYVALSLAARETESAHTPDSLCEAQRSEQEILSACDEVMLYCEEIRKARWVR